MRLLFARGPLLGLRLLFWVTLSVTLLILDHRQQLTTINSRLAVIVTPLQYAVAWPSRFVSTIQTNFATRKALLNENALLHKQDLLNKAQLQRLHFIENENQQLRILLKAVMPMSNQRFMIAQIMEIGADSFVNEILLDKGSVLGVYEGQPVLDAQGIMGQIIQTTPYTGRVLLITDLRSAIPVQNSRTGNRSIAVGTGNPNLLKLIHVPITSDFKKGDLLMSSGLGKRYPSGYPVGIITSVSLKAGDQFATILIKPSAQINQAQQVILIWPPKTIATSPIPATRKTSSLHHAQR